MAKAEKFRVFDPARYLGTDEEIAAYLAAAAEGGDECRFASALGTVARARNLSKLARDTGLTRQGLDKALSADGNPSLATTMKVLCQLGYELDVRPRRVQTSGKKSAVRAGTRRPARSKGTSSAARKTGSD